MNEQQRNILQKYEHTFHTVIRYGYARRLSRIELEEIAEVYRQLTGEEIKGTFTCSSCRLTLLKKTARLYYEDTQKKKQRK